MEKEMKEIERATINRSKEEDEERVAKTNLVTERIGRTETGKKQQKEEEEREETKKEVKKLKRLMEDREEGKEKQPSNQKIKRKREKEPDSAQKFLEEEFEVKGGVKEVQIAGGEVIIIQMDS